MSRPLPPGWTRPVEADEGTDELREALAQWIDGGDKHDEFTWPAVDDLINGPLAPLLAKVQAVEATVTMLDDIAKVIEYEVEDAEPSQYRANELGKAMGYRRSARDLRRALDGAT